MNRRQWFSWHSWAGFQLSILMCFVLVTGTIATVSMDLDWAFNSAIRAQHGQPKTLDWGAILDSATRAHPDDEILWLRAPHAPWFNAEVAARSAESGIFRIYIDPVTHNATGTGRWYNWQRFFRQTHRHLMLPTQVGVVIVSLLSIPLFISFISGFYIYKRWWRGFFRWPKRVRPSTPTKPIRRSRTLWGALHRLAGVWSLWFILLIAVTGAWYLAEELGVRPDYPAIPEVAVDSTATLDGDTVNQLLTAAARHYPQLDITYISLQAWSKNRILFRGQADALLVRDRANHVAMNPSTGLLIDLRQGESLGLHARISEAADPLHFGTFGGTITRYLWFLFGVLLSGLGLSGVYLLGLRLSAAAVTQPISAWKLSWRALPVTLRRTTLALVLFALTATTLVFIFDTP